MQFGQLKRREFVTLLGCAAAWPLAARAQQQTMPVVGYLQRAAPIRNDFGKFLDGLRALGYEEGRNIRIERHYGNSDDKRLRELAQELSRLKPVVIVVDGPMTIGMVQAATTTIPIVSAIMGDPELFGITQLMLPRWPGELEEEASMSMSHSSSAARFTAARASFFDRGRPEPMAPSVRVRG
jgi:hypothetical protein